MNKILKLILKLIVASLLLYVVSRKIDLVDLFQNYMGKVNIYLFLGFIITIILAQTLSAQRMEYYFNNLGARLNIKESCKIYFTSMFLNFFLPGGIGGDAFKLLYISKKYSIAKLNSLRATISERASGLFALCLIMLIIATLSISLLQIAGPLLLLMILIAIILLSLSYFTLAKILLQENTETSYGAFKYSLTIQLVSVLGGFFLLESLSPDLVMTSVIDFVIVFLISNIVAIIPISIGGVGLREVTFLYLAPIFGFDIELGIAFSLLYLFGTFIVSIIGVFFLHDFSKIIKKGRRFRPPFSKQS